jgi:hypothetical protein
MKPWIKAGLIVAGIIVILSTVIFGAQLEKSTHASGDLGLGPFYLVSVLLGAAIIVIGARIRIRSTKISEPENSAK